MADLSSDSRWQGDATRDVAPAPALAQRAGWDRLVVIFGLWFAVALAYWPSSVALNGFWTDTVDKAYTHGYLILAISLWLVIRDRRRVFAAPLRPEPRALIAVGLLSLAWVYCYGAALQDPQLLVLPLLLFGVIVATLGWPLARTLVFPIGFLYFAMPAWTDINALLQSLSVLANGFLVWMIGIPAYLTGDFVHLPGGTLEIAWGCSGLHFFVVGLALAALYGALANDSVRRRVLWLALMGLFALVGNWIRIFVIIVAAYETNMQTYLVTVSHYWFGWAVFVVFFLVFLWLAGRLAIRWDRRAAAARCAPVAPPASLAADPEVASPGRAFGALAVLGVLPLLIYAQGMIFPVAEQPVAIHWPVAPAGWSGPERVTYSAWSPQYLNASAESLQRYQTPQGHSVQAFAVAYRTQTQDGKLLGYWNSLLGGKTGLILLGTRTVASPSGRWQEMTVKDHSGVRSLLWSRVTIGTRRFVDARVSQLWYGIVAFTTRPVSSRIALRAICHPNCAAARARLTQASAELVPAVQVESGT